MKRNRLLGRIAAVATAVMCAVILLPQTGGSVRAADPAIEWNKDATLTITHVYPGNESVMVNGVKSTIWQVASVDENGHYTLLFDIPGVDKEELNDYKSQSEWDKLMDQVKPYIFDNKIPSLATGTSGTGLTKDGTQKDGKFYYGVVDKGIYLVISDDLEREIEETVDGLKTTRKETIHYVDTFVAVPGRTPETIESGKLIFDVYDVDATPKKSREEGGEIQEYQVLKRWNDSGYGSLRPTYITINIYDQSGKLVESNVTLSSANNWSYKWSGDAGMRFTVAEASNANYSVTYTRNGGSITMVNTYTPTTPPPPPSETPTPPPGETPTPPPGETPTPPPGETPTPPPGDTPPTVSTETPSLLNSLRDMLNEAPSVLGANRKPNEDTPAVLGARRLPQTGQLWWPVPVLIFLGLFLIVMGLKVEKRRRQDLLDAAAEA